MCSDKNSLELGMVGPVYAKGGEVSYNRSLCHPILVDFKFIVLLKTVFTFNHKSNDAIVSKIYHTFQIKLYAVDGG